MYSTALIYDIIICVLSLVTMALLFIRKARLKGSVRQCLGGERQ